MKKFKLLVLLLIGLSLLVSCDPDQKPEPTPTPSPIPPQNNTVKTFHLNYKKDKDWSLCGKRDYIIFDMFDNSKEDFKKCADMGATMLCYFSSQYEEWRPDKKNFGKLGKKLDGWKGENWIDPNDPKNLEVMYKRLDLAKEKCSGVDIDNIDRKDHEEYVLNIFKKAKEKGLSVSQKNHVGKIAYFYDYVDTYQNEQCQQYNECDKYKNIGKPVFNIEYKSNCKKIPYMFSVIKDVNDMDKNFKICE